MTQWPSPTLKINVINYSKISKSGCHIRQDVADLKLNTLVLTCGVKFQRHHLRSMQLFFASLSPVSCSERKLHFGVNSCKALWVCAFLEMCLVSWGHLWLQRGRHWNSALTASCWTQICFQLAKETLSMAAVGNPRSYNERYILHIFGKMLAHKRVELEPTRIWLNSITRVSGTTESPGIPFGLWMDKFSNTPKWPLSLVWRHEPGSMSNGQIYLCHYNSCFPRGSAADKFVIIESCLICSQSLLIVALRIGMVSQ